MDQDISLLQDLVGTRGAALLCAYGSLRAVARAVEDGEPLGLSDRQYASLRAACGLARRLQSTVAESHVRSPLEVLPYLADMASLESEHVRVIVLNTKNAVLGCFTLYQGTTNSCTMRAAEVFREAVRRNGTAVIIAHNHPSGDPTPSPEDVAVTRNLVDAGRTLDNQVLDHLVIGADGCYVSLKERRLGF